MPTKAISGRPVDQQRHQPVIAIGRRLRRDLDALLVERLHQIWVVGRIDREGLAVRVVTGDLRPGDCHILDVPGIGFGQQLAVIDLLRRRALARLLEQHHQRHDQQDDDHPECEIA